MRPMTELDRRQYIGGATAPIIVLGEHFGKTRTMLWEYYRGERDFPEVDTPDTRRGKRQERIAIEWYSEKTGNRVTQPGFMVHDTYEFLCGHIDGKVIDQGKLIEIKVPRSQKYQSYKEDGIPNGYLIQCMHYLSIYPDCDSVDIIIYNPMDDDGFIVTVNRDEALINAIEGLLVAFWNSVKANERLHNDEPLVTLPEPTGDILRVDDEEHIALIERYQNANEVLKLAEAELEAVRLDIRTYMADRQKIQGVGGKIYNAWQAGRKTLDEGLLTAAHPDIDLDKFKKQGEPFKSMRVYPRKEKHE